MRLRNVRLPTTSLSSRRTCSGSPDPANFSMVVLLISSMGYCSGLSKVSPPTNNARAKSSPSSLPLPVASLRISLPSSKRPTAPATSARSRWFAAGCPEILVQSVSAIFRKDKEPAFRQVEPL